MATVTYQGVPSEVGGNIFANRKFWVARRVPIRNELLEKIRQNGGEVVPLEKHADMLIADHAMKDVPPGSFSWKFITESVENGFIQVEDRYRIGLDPNTPRPVGGGAGSKRTRTSFTKADDALLAKWVLSSNSNHQGNIVYQDLAKACPRHPWQSWRNRFVKVLRNLSMGELEKLAESASEEVSNVPAGPGEPAGETVGEAPAPPEEPQGVPESREVPESPPVEVKQEEPDSQPHFISRHDQHAEEPAQGQQNDEPASQPEEEPDEGETPKAIFYRDLRDFARETDLKIDPEPEIRGRRTGLWDLAQAVNESTLPSGSVDWKSVAVKLHFKAQDEAAMVQLRNCYEEILVEFFDVMSSFAEEDEEREEEEAEDYDRPEREPSLFFNDIPEAHGEMDFEPEQEPQSQMPSSPPMEHTALRRLHPHQPLPSSGAQLKRSRYKSGDEIQETPEHGHSTALHLQDPDAMSPSISRAQRRQTYNDASEASQQLPPLPKDGEREIVEVSETEEEEASDREAQADITPSQQLRFENRNPAPIPYRGEARRQSVVAGPTGRAMSKPLGRARSREILGAVPVPTNSATASQSNQKRKRSLPASFSSAQQPLQKVARETPAPELARPTPAAPSTRPAASASDVRNRREIQDYISHYQSHGYSRDIVIEGLKRTTLTPGKLARLVMESLADGKPVPSHYEGIWTDRDDGDLTLVTRTDLTREPKSAEEKRLHKTVRKAEARLVNKHGTGRVELRKQFLEAQGLDEGSSMR